MAMISLPLFVSSGLYAWNEIDWFTRPFIILNWLKSFRFPPQAASCVWPALNGAFFPPLHGSVPLGNCLYSQAAQGWRNSLSTFSPFLSFLMKLLLYLPL